MLYKKLLSFFKFSFFGKFVPRDLMTDIAKSFSEVICCPLIVSFGFSLTDELEFWLFIDCFIWFGVYFFISSRDLSSSLIKLTWYSVSYSLFVLNPEIVLLKTK